MSAAMISDALLQDSTSTTTSPPPAFADLGQTPTMPSSPPLIATTQVSAAPPSSPPPPLAPSKSATTASAQVSTPPPSPPPPLAPSKPATTAPQLSTPPPSSPPPPLAPSKPASTAPQLSAPPFSSASASAKVYPSSPPPQPARQTFWQWFVNMFGVSNWLKNVPVRNKLFITICISGLILTGATDIHYKLKNVVYLFSLIRSIPNERFIRASLSFLFIMTMAYYVLFLYWLGKGVVFEKEILSAPNTLISPTGINFTSRLMVGATYLVAGLVGCIGVITWLRARAIKARDPTSWPASQVMSLFMELTPNVILMVMIGLLPTGYAIVLE